MTRSAITRLCLVTLALASCGRAGRTPGTTGLPTAAATDTQTARLVREQLARQRDDSIRQTVTAPAAPPVAEPATPPARTTTTAEPAPGRPCVLDLLNTPDTRVQRIQDPITQKYFTYIGGGVLGQCRGQDITIQADSAESYEINDLHILIGRVKYREARYSIDAARATYFRTEERILFQDDVHVSMPEDGASLDGPSVEYYRPVAGLRTRARVVATQRPRLTYVERDSAGTAQPPVHVYANTIIGDGDSTFHAGGLVRLERHDVLATSDSALLDARGQFARLMVNPKIESLGDEPFTLTGRMVDLHGSGRVIHRVVAIDSGRAVSDQFTLTADTIDLRLTDNELQRAFAFGNTGAWAVTPGRDVIADSLDIVLPNQRIRELRAVGKAYAESDPDTVRIETDERDWIRGDTLIARFDSVAAADSTPPRLRDLFASGQASAYYQVPADSANRSRPGINYITGRVIRLVFADGEVQTVNVTDQVSGVYLAPLPPDEQRGVDPRPPGVPPRRPPDDSRSTPEHSR